VEEDGTERTKPRQHRTNPLTATPKPANQPDHACNPIHVEPESGKKMYDRLSMYVYRREIIAITIIKVIIVLIITTVNE